MPTKGPRQIRRAEEHRARQALCFAGRGRSVKDISRILGVGKPVVRRILRAAGVANDQRGERKSP